MKIRVNVTCTNDANRKNEKTILKNNVTFRSCLLKIHNAFIENEDLDTGIAIYNLLDCSDNYPMTSENCGNCGIVIKMN